MVNPSNQLTATETKDEADEDLPPLIDFHEEEKAVKMNTLETNHDEYRGAINDTSFTFIERLKYINALQRMNEMVTCAVKTLVFNNIKSYENLADVLTKPLDGSEFHTLVNPHLSRNPK